MPLLSACSRATLGPLQEASIAWEKRQAEVRAKVQQEADANAWSSWWDNVAGEGVCLLGSPGREPRQEAATFGRAHFLENSQAKVYHGRFFCAVLNRSLSCMGYAYIP